MNTPDNNQDEMALKIKAQEAILQVEQELESIKIHMRNANPALHELAFIRIACIDICRHLEDVSAWAATAHRNGKNGKDKRK